MKRYLSWGLAVVLLWLTWRQAEYARLYLAAQKDGWKGETAKNELLLAFPGKEEDRIAFLHLKIAVGKMNIKKPDEALYHLHNAKLLSPRFYGFHSDAVEAVHLLGQQGRTEDALREFEALFTKAEEACAHPPDNPDELLKEIAPRLRHKTPWRTNFRQVGYQLHQNIGHAFAIFLLRTKRKEFRAPERALQIAKAMAERNEDNAFFWEFLSFVEYENAHNDKALLALDYCENLHPQMKFVPDSRWKQMRQAVLNREEFPLQFRLLR